jgi:hypothetical protein
MVGRRFIDTIKPIVILCEPARSMLHSGSRRWSKVDSSPSVSRDTRSWIKSFMLNSDEAQRQASGHRSVKSLDSYRFLRVDEEEEQRYAAASRVDGRPSLAPRYVSF